jgi:hypothetical protein
VIPKTDKKMIAIIDDRLSKSVPRDLFSLATMAAMVGFGVLLNSNAMQWLGAVIWFTWIIGRTSKQYKDTHMTIADARKLLDDLESAS